MATYTNSRPAPGVSRSVCAETTHGAGQTETERQVDRGETPTKSRIARLKTFGDLIDLHIDDMCDVGKSPRRSKAAALDMLQSSIASLDRERLIRFGRDRATQGGCPMTLGIDVGFVKLILAHAAAVHGLPVRVEPIDLARIALKRLASLGRATNATGGRRRMNLTGSPTQKFEKLPGTPAKLMPCRHICFPS